MHGQWKPDDRYLTHLPMYSMLEFSFIHAVLLAGYPVGFGTLQEKFLLSAPYDNGFLHPDSAGDFATFQPTFTYGIMPWWSIVADIIHNEMLGHKSAEERAQFWLWYNRKKMLLKKHIGFPAAIRHAERKAGINTIRNTLLGGRIRWIANYCSRMPKEKREFLGLVLGGERGIMIEGWTLQELNTLVSMSVLHGFIHGR